MDSATYCGKCNVSAFVNKGKNRKNEGKKCVPAHASRCSSPPPARSEENAFTQQAERDTIKKNKKQMLRRTAAAEKRGGESYAFE